MRILLTGCGAPGAVGIIRDLKSSTNHEIFGCDSNPNAAGRSLCLNFFKVPRAIECAHFIDRVSEVILKNKIEIVLPLVTAELELWAQLKSQLRGVNIVVPEINTLKILNNKLSLLEYFTEQNLPAPWYHRIADKTELIQAINYNKLSDEKFVIKLASSNGSRGIRIFDPGYNYFESFINDKPSSLVTSLDEFLRNFPDGPIPELFITEFLPGMEFTVDTIFKDGHTSLLLIRTRDEMRSGISTKGTFIKNEFIEKQISIIGRKLRLNGPIGFQFRCDKYDVPKILEVNPRMQGTSVASKTLNINFPLNVIKNELNENLCKPDWNNKIKFARYYDEVFF